MDTQPFTVEKKETHFTVTFQAGTALTHEFIIAAISLEQSKPELRGLNDIWDLRNCSIDETFKAATMSRVKDFIESTHTEETYTNKTALLVDQPLVFGMSRMFSGLASDLPVKIKVFNDENVALAWILTP